MVFEANQKAKCKINNFDLPEYGIIPVSQNQTLQSLHRLFIIEIVTVKDCIKGVKRQAFQINLYFKVKPY